MFVLVAIVAVFFGVTKAEVVTQWPAPNKTARPIFHLGGIDNAPGYVGDANGLMFRRVPFDSTTDANGLYHVSWQCSRYYGSGLNWCHSTSKDFVRWKPLPPIFSYGGAESGGVAQLKDGDAIAIFNQIGGGGHWQARPLNRSDPDLVEWRATFPNGTFCDGQNSCAATPGIPGTDLSQAFRFPGSGDDEKWYVVSNRPDAGGAVGAAMLSSTKDFEAFQVENTFIEYAWDRCVSLPSLCGFGPYPRDPNLFHVKDDIWVFYGMQKTCSFSGREFYVLGKVAQDTMTFVPLNNRSGYANNVWDGGEGYAAMHLADPLNENRILWIGAVIEGDRDACGDAHGEGFWNDWMVERDIGRGWFGTLGLPRVVDVENLTLYLAPNDPESRDVHLVTSPLPELAKLRKNKSAVKRAPSRLKGGAPWSSDIRAQSLDVLFVVNGSEFQPGDDLAVHVLWSDDDSERTTIGLREATRLVGIDLWDEINGDMRTLNSTSVDRCANECAATENCTAWTFSNGRLCRLKRFAQHAVQIASANGAFQPYHDNCTSGYATDSSSSRWFSLYVDRTRSTTAVPTMSNYSYPTFGYAKSLLHVPELDGDSVRIEIFVDRSIVEVFGQGGRSVVTARVYPANPSSTRVGVVNLGRRALSPSVLGFDVWEMDGALEGKESSGEGEDGAASMSAMMYVDSRDITQAVVALEEEYVDQPYCTVIPYKNASRWACVATITESGGGEGGFGEHVVSMWSEDRGKTWSEAAAIEAAPPKGLPNAYAIVASSVDDIVPRTSSNVNGRRIYAIYNFNANNITMSGRDDELGYFYLKYSDDGGESWSDERYPVPYPETWIDRNNVPFRGSTKIMWTVDPCRVTSDGSVVFAFTKIGAYVQNPPEEIFVMRSSNLMHATDPKDIDWIMLPENVDHGIRCLESYNCSTTVNEEGHVLPLSTFEDTYVVMARTSIGYLSQTTTDASLRQLTPTKRAEYFNTTTSKRSTFEPLSNVTDVRTNKTLVAGIKHPRGPFTPKRLTKEGVYLMLFYNNAGGGSFGRDPYFLSCGHETDRSILWSQPEIGIYDREYRGGTSGGGYPDFVFTRNESNRFPDVTIVAAQKGLPQPQKSRAYVVNVEPSLIEQLCLQHINAGDISGFTPAVVVDENRLGQNVTSPSLPATGKGATREQDGFTIVMRSVDTLFFGGDESSDGVLFESAFLRLVSGTSPTTKAMMNFTFHDTTGASFNGQLGAMCLSLLASDVAHGSHFFAIVVDAGAGVVSFIVDGVFCDGSWGWIGVAGIDTIPSSGTLVAKTPLAIYTRALTTSQLVSMYRGHLGRRAAGRATEGGGCATTSDGA
eukprot:g3785.t1